ncbi:serine/threonine-protein kinase [Rubellicoccus peritrichatus]|uniref:Serine/threonine-protein kinase n=1 Tax=Rubellicoccus peritrichatus TaxID=3080537 RepID=A0AAQ3L9K6_9BACT|nr:serine/threonine-protein kinase [Puniceicoccus sp. CR14]WOO41366.1 serine/threonine-protein kinase [Puniceicoccus sp. CR14]
MISAGLQDRYRLLRHLADGGSSRVYLAESLSDDTPVVLKCMHSRGAWSSVGLREFSSMLSLEHPRILRCLDFHYLQDGECILVFEYIRGGSLRDYLETQVAWDLKAIVHLLSELFDGLHYLHSRGLIHCDLKPENILIEKKDANEVHYKLVDFGVSQRGSDQGTDQGNLRGSPAYLAPEQFYERFESNADLYSVGVILYEIIAGYRPCDGTPEDIIRAQRRGFDFKPLDNHPLASLVRRLLEMDPRDRISSARDALALLEQLSQMPAELELPVEVPVGVVATDKVEFEGGLQLERRASVKLLDDPERLIPLQKGSGAMLAIDHGQHITFYCPTSGRICQACRDKGSLSIEPLLDGSIAYVRKDAIVRYEPQTQKEQVLEIGCHGIRSFHLNYEQQCLVWAGDDAIHYRELNERGGFDLPTANYGIGNGLKILPDGRLWVASSALNPAMRIYSRQGQLLEEHKLPGPMVAHSKFGDSLFFVCLNHEESWHYSLFSYTNELSSSVEITPDRIRQIVFNRDALMLLLNSREILSFNTNLKRKYLGRISAHTAHLLITVDNRYIYEVTDDPDNPQLITYYNKAS